MFLYSMNYRPNGKLRYRCRPIDCILHCSDKNVVLTTSVAGARAVFLCKATAFIFLEHFGY